MADSSPEPFLSCAKCGHNIVDEPAKNKSVVRDNKRVQLQWEKNSTTVTNFFRARECPSRTKRAILQRRSRIQNFQRSHICATAGSNACHTLRGDLCFYGCVVQITGKQYEESQCPICLCDCAFVCTEK